MEALLAKRHENMLQSVLGLLFVYPFSGDEVVVYSCCCHFSSFPYRYHTMEFLMCSMTVLVFHRGSRCTFYILSCLLIV